MKKILGKYKNLKGEYNFYKELIGSSLSRFGDGIDTIAFSILIYHITGSTMLVATLFAVNGLPNLIFSIVSGAVSTYKDEKKIMAICDIGRGLCVTAIVLLYISGRIEIWHLYVITFLNSSFESFRSPASASMLPKILREELREEGLALETSSMKLMEVFGLAIAATIIGWGGLEAALMIDALTFLVCGILVMTMKVEKKPYQKLEFSKGVKDIQEGFQYVKLHKKVLSICIFTCIINIAFIPINVYQVPYVEDILKGQDMMLSVMGVSSAVAMGVFALFMPKLKEFLGEKKSFFLGGILLGIAASNFIIQVRFFAEIEQEYLARVSAISSMFALCIVPVFSSLSGILLNFISIPLLFVLSGTFAILVFGANYIKEIKQE